MVDSVLHSDGAWSGALRLGWTGPIQMDGRTVIMQASRKIPAAIQELLQRNGVAAESVADFPDAPGESESDRPGGAQRWVPTRTGSTRISGGMETHRRRRC